MGEMTAPALLVFHVRRDRYTTGGECFTAMCEDFGVICGYGDSVADAEHDAYMLAEVVRQDFGLSPDAPRATWLSYEL